MITLDYAPEWDFEKQMVSMERISNFISSSRYMINITLHYQRLYYSVRLRQDLESSTETPRR